MNEKENKKKFSKVLLRCLLIIALAIVVGFTGSVGYQIWRVASGRSSSTVVGSPVIDEFSDTGDVTLTPTPTVAISKLSLSTSDVSAITECMTPAIVEINCRTIYTQTDFFGRQRQYEGSSSGTGFFVSQSSSKLFIATNNHVVDGASSITVTMASGSTVNADIVGTDSGYDLAVISINLGDLKSEDLNTIRIASLGDSDDVEVGDLSVAIGNALGYGISTTVGYISALDREVTVENATNKYIQTDTAINPGNSGGPLINAYGQVIGITSVKVASTNVEGIGYAIPITTAIPIINDLITEVTLDESEMGYLGIEGKDITEAYSTGFGMPMGVYVFNIVENSPAATSNLRQGDIITAINGRNVTTMTDLRNRISRIRAGETVELTVYTIRNGAYEEHTVTVTLAHRPSEQ